METQSCLEDQLVLLEATIEDNKEMKRLVERVLLEKGLEEAVTTVVSSWGKEQRARAQQEVITRAGPYWKVLLTYYHIHIHISLVLQVLQLFKVDITLNVTRSHRVFIQKVFKR